MKVRMVLFTKVTLVYLEIGGDDRRADDGVQSSGNGLARKAGRLEQKLGAFLLCKAHTMFHFTEF